FGRIPSSGRPPACRTDSWRRRHCQPMKSSRSCWAATSVSTTLFSGRATASHRPFDRAILALVEQQRLDRGVVAHADDAADEDHMVAAVIGMLGPAFEIGGAAGQDRTAGIPQLEVNLLPLVGRGLGEAGGEVGLLQAEDIDREMVGREE